MSQKTAVQPAAGKKTLFAEIRDNVRMIQEERPKTALLYYFNAVFPDAVTPHRLRLRDTSQGIGTGLDLWLVAESCCKQGAVLVK